jgi:hypothetical protein
MRTRKREIDQEQLINDIKQLQSKYPPINEKNIKRAFRERSDNFPPTLNYRQWEQFYKDGRNAKDIALDIINAPTIRITNTFGGWGGKRGLNRKWARYRKAEKILFRTDDLFESLKYQKFKMKRSKFFVLFHTYEKEKTLPANYSPEMKDLLRYCFAVLYKVESDWENALDKNNAKHTRAVQLLMGEEYPLDGAIKAKGKQVTMNGILKAVDLFSDYINGRIKGRQNEKFYKDKKFYYLTYLASLIISIGDLTNAKIKEAAMKKVRTTLAPFSIDERTQILRGIIAQEFKENIPIRRLLGLSKTPH